MNKYNIHYTHYHKTCYSHKPRIKCISLLLMLSNVFFVLRSKFRHLSLMYKRPSRQFRG